jgi:hypothetical protein
VREFEFKQSDNKSLYARGCIDGDFTYILMIFAKMPKLGFLDGFQNPEG